jgi:3-deoxy-7-phosphoheptulonate synthase
MLLKIKRNNKNASKIIKQFLKNKLSDFKIFKLDNFIKINTTQKEILSSLIGEIEALDIIENIEPELDELCPKTMSIENKKEFMVIAGPCAIENEETYNKIAKELKALKIKYIRAPIFKPRKSPYSFQGIGLKAKNFLVNVKKNLNLTLVSEALSPIQIEEISEVSDIIQIGARNMRNYELLKEAANVKNEILLKRAPGASLKEWLLSCEYLSKSGKSNIILCERGDYPLFGDNSALNFNIALKAKYAVKLPVIIDISHSSQNKKFVSHMAMAAAAMGFDGIMVETHINPQKSISDGRHIISLSELKEILKRIKKIKACLK